eukprot:2216050-Amphidinium_carterae.1
MRLASLASCSAKGGAAALGRDTPAFRGHDASGHRHQGTSVGEVGGNTGCGLARDGHLACAN